MYKHKYLLTCNCVCSVFPLKTNGPNEGCRFLFQNIGIFFIILESDLQLTVKASEPLAAW